MKGIIIILILLSVAISGSISFADTATITATGTFDVGDVFSLTFYESEPDKYLYTTEVPFTNVDPTQTWVQADARSANDGKNDIGLLCKSNLGEIWYLQIQGSPNDFFLSKLRYGFWRPWNMKTGGPADGALNEGWHAIPAATTIIYTAGSEDLNNLGNEEWQQGTLCGFSFAVDPSKLVAEQIYQCTVQFTLTTST